MIGIYLIEIISFIAFIIGILVFILPFTTINNLLLLFIYGVTISFLSAYLMKKNKKYIFINLFILLPIILFKTESSSIFILILTFAIIFYIKNSFGKISHGIIIRQFKISLSLMSFLLFSSPLIGNHITFYPLSLPFFTIYFVSTIMLSRSLRNIENQGNIKKINIINTKYSILLIILTFLLSLKKLRSIISKSLKVINNFLVDIVLKVFYWPIVGLAYLGEKFINWIISLSGEKTGVEEFVEGQKDFTELFTEAFKDLPPVSISIGNIIYFLLKFLTITFIIYIIIKIFKRQSLRRREEDYYIEEREFIKTKKEKKPNKFLSFIKPKNNEELVRYYYRKYLLKCEKEEIPIDISDTTLDVNNKSKKNFNKKAIDKLRDVYIKVRYGEKIVNRNVLKQYKENYRKISDIK